MGWELRRGKNVQYLTVPAWERAGVEVAFSTRQGGLSGGRYASLNLGLHVGDSPELILANRRLWLSEFGVLLERAVIGEQTHGSAVTWVGEADAGRGAKELAAALPGIDGMLTRASCGLMAFFADCIPLFFYHPALKAVGIAHAGWKGTVGKIALNILDKMAAAGGAPQECWVAIGPGIGACCYEVDEAVARQFRAAFRKTPFLQSSRPGHFLLDLRQANREILLAAGVLAEHIWLDSHCTACAAELFFSHRRDGAPTGRMAGWIRLKRESWA